MHSFTRSLIILALLYVLFRIIVKCVGFKNQRNRQRYMDAPHYAPYDLIGILLPWKVWGEFCRSELNEGFRKRHHHLGPTFVATFLGKQIIYTVDPSNIRAATTTHFEEWGKAKWTEEAIKHIGNGILINQGEAWKKSRSALRPMFKRTTLDEHSMLDRHVKNLLAGIKKTQGTPFRFTEIAAMFTLDVVSEFLFGRSTCCLSKDANASSKQDALVFLEHVSAFEKPSAEFFAAGALTWPKLLLGFRKSIRAVKGMKHFFQKKLEESLEYAAEGFDASQIPASVFGRMKQENVPINQIRGELQNIFFASFDTTSALLTNAIDILSRRLDIQNKLRWEITKHCGSGITKHSISKVQYLHCFLLEG
jgi:cytochrome P450